MKHYDKYKHFIIAFGVLFFIPAKVFGFEKTGLVVFIIACLLGKFEDIRRFMKDKKRKN
jgi:uncharacterized membrane protein